MNTPEQIAEKAAVEIDDLIYHSLPNTNIPLAIKPTILSAIHEATQPLHQRLIDAEVQVGKIEDVLELSLSILDSDLWKHGISKWHEEKRSLIVSALYSPRPRTYEAFMAMVNALEGSTEALKHCYDVTEWPADGTSDQDAAIKVNESAIKQAKEVVV